MRNEVESIKKIVMFVENKYVGLKTLTGGILSICHISTPLKNFLAVIIFIVRGISELHSMTFLLNTKATVI